MSPDPGPRSDNVVFIVDDDEGVRSSLKMLVRSIGFQPEVYCSGEEFLDAYDGRDSGCVLLDVRMPGMSGLEVRQRLEAMEAKIPVIFLTAQGEDEFPARAGPVAVVQKPFRDQELIDRINELVDF